MEGIFGNQAKKTFADMKKKAQRKRSNIKTRYGIDLSEEIQIPSSIDDFKDRASYFAWKKQIGSFVDRKNQDYSYMQNKHGLVITKRQFSELKAGTKEHREKAKAEAKAMENLPYIEDGKKIETLGQRAEKIGIGEAMGITMPEQFDRESFESIKDPRTIGAKVKANEKRKNPDFYDERKVQMQQNYIEMMFFILDQDNPDHMEVLQFVQNMDPNDFYNMYYSDKESLAFNMYPSKESQLNGGEMPEPSAMLTAIGLYELNKESSDSDVNRLKNF